MFPARAANKWPASSKELHHLLCLLQACEVMLGQSAVSGSVGIMHRLVVLLMTAVTLHKP